MPSSSAPLGMPQRIIPQRWAPSMPRHGPRIRASPCPSCSSARTTAWGSPCPRHRTGLGRVSPDARDSVTFIATGWTWRIAGAVRPRRNRPRAKSARQCSCMCAWCGSWDMPARTRNRNTAHRSQHRPTRTTTRCCTARAGWLKPVCSHPQELRSCISALSGTWRRRPKWQSRGRNSPVRMKSCPRYCLEPERSCRHRCHCHRHVRIKSPSPWRGT